MIGIERPILRTWHAGVVGIRPAEPAIAAGRAESQGVGSFADKVTIVAASRAASVAARARRASSVG